MIKQFIGFGLLMATAGSITYWQWSNHSVSTKPVEKSERTPSSLGHVATVNSEILQIKSPDDILRVAHSIMELDSRVNPIVNGKRSVTDEGLRVYALGARLVPHLEGGIYRLRHVVEKNFVLYGAAITALRNFKYGSDHSPAHINAIFDYLTNPNPEKVILGHKGPFQNITELQSFVAEKLAPEIEAVATELNILIKSNNNLTRPVLVLDASLAFGTVHADKLRHNHSDISVDKIVLAGHLLKVVAAAREALGTIYYAGSFNIAGTNEFANKLYMQAYKASHGRGLTAWLGDISSANNLPSPKEKKDAFEAVRRDDPNFLKANSNANAYLAKSWEHFKQSANLEVEYHNFLFDQASKMASPDSYVVNADLFKEHGHETMEFFNKKKELFFKKGGYVSIDSHLSGNALRVNLGAMFDPANVSDLGYFLPTAFHGPHEIIGKGADTFAWDYNYGKPKQWPQPTFSRDANATIPGLFEEAHQKDVRHNIGHIMQFSPLYHLSSLLGLYI